MYKISTVSPVRYLLLLLRISFHYKGIRALTLLMCFSITASVQAQNATFYESFDAVSEGEVPNGWKWYSLGGSSPSEYWRVSRYGFFGPRVMYSGGAADVAMEGEIDIDWIVMPQVTPAAGDFLIFDAAQEFVWDDFGSTIKILVSTASSNRPDFTHVLAEYTETEFPGYMYDTKIMLDLAEFAGQPVYIAFVHENPSTDPEFTESFYIDNVWVRPVKAVDFYSAEIYSENQGVIRTEESYWQIIQGVKVRTTGELGTANITSLTFSKLGTTADVRITKAILYTTHQDAFIGSDPENGVSADVFGEVVNPGETFSFTGDQELTIGDNHFWLVYLMETDEEPVYPYPQADAVFESVVVNGVAYEATIKSKTGSHPLVPAMPVNDNYADAIELSVNGRYGSFNDRGTYETDYERLAYCSAGATQDGFNTVWWHFKATTDGMITVDLSSCQFNTLLVLQDKDFNQLACNNDIDTDARIYQSKISDFEVKAGQDIYIRVSGTGWPGDPNAESGVIHLDFTYTVPVGVKDPIGNFAISALYPNPADGHAYVDLMLRRPADVVLDVCDLFGRRLLVQDAGFLDAGVHERIGMDVASLPAGTYVVHIRGGNSDDSTRKLVVKR